MRLLVEVEGAESCGMGGLWGRQMLLIDVMCNPWPSPMWGMDSPPLSALVGWELFGVYSHRMVGLVLHSCYKLGSVLCCVGTLQSVTCYLLLVGM